MFAVVKVLWLAEHSLKCPTCNTTADHTWCFFFHSSVRSVSTSCADSKPVSLWGNHAWQKFSQCSHGQDPMRNLHNARSVWINAAVLHALTCVARKGKDRSKFEVSKRLAIKLEKCDVYRCLVDELNLVVDGFWASKWRSVTATINNQHHGQLAHTARNVSITS